ncbi:Intracellular distribution of mitochondria, partial [Blyttiomyces sp. JEL0837]
MTTTDNAPAEEQPVIEQQEEVAPEVVPEVIYTIYIALPRNQGRFKVHVPPSAIVQEVRQHIIDSHEGLFYTCFHLEHNGQQLIDGQELSTIEGLSDESVFAMVEDPYTEREIRVHITRLREILTNFKTTAPSLAIDSGISYLSTVSGSFDIHPIILGDEEDAANNKENGETTKSKGSKKSKDGKKESANGKQQQQQQQEQKTPETTPHAFVDYNFDSQSKEKDSTVFLIPENYASATGKEPCLRSITVSSWNPPPHHRRLVGDFLYLTVNTLENQTLQITCNVAGFHVSRSSDKIFDPSPRTVPKLLQSHTLPGLLSQASPLFNTRFEALQIATIRRHPYEYLLTNTPKNPWLVSSPIHDSDIGRALDSYVAASDAIELLSSRDWNDDLQSARELPRSHSQEKVTRDQTIYRQYMEFVDAAAKGVVSIVSRSLSPINPEEIDETAQMYIHGGMFFSHGNDSKESFERFGGAAAAHVAVGKDVDGINVLMGLDLEGLYTLGTAVVDFKGQRIVAQSIIPGILKRQQQQILKMQERLEELEKADAGEDVKVDDVNEEIVDNVVVYGSVDGGKTIGCDKEFHEIAGKVAKALHLDEHEVLDGNGKAHRLFMAVDTKGIVGNDG